MIPRQKLADWRSTFSRMPCSLNVSGISSNLKLSNQYSLLGPTLHHNSATHARRFTSCPVAMAKPSKKGPETTVKVFCTGCKTQLYKYRKGGTGNLVKCFIERIAEDFTGGSLECPNCGVQFARPAMIRGRPANKMVGGKVFFQK